MYKVFLDNHFVDDREAKVSIFDHGFLFGDGLFETIRSYGGVPFLLKEHMERLYRGAEALEIKIPYEKERLMEIVKEAVSINELKEAYIRITVTRGVGKPGLDPRTCPKPSVIVVALPLTAYPNDAYEKGWKAIIVNTRRNHPSALNPEIKSMNFLNNIFAKMETIRAQVPEGIMLNHQGYVVESVVSNIFIVKNEKVLTPDVSLGLLPGITRDIIIKLCQGHQIEVREAKILPEELYEADECFTTNSLAEVLPIVNIDENIIGTGSPGEMTTNISGLYRELIEKETSKTDI